MIRLSHDFTHNCKLCVFFSTSEIIDESQVELFIIHVLSVKVETTCLGIKMRK